MNAWILRKYHLMSSVGVDNSERPTGLAASLSRWLRWLIREPLVHFFIAGAVLFAVNAAIAPPSVSKERLIEVNPDLRESIVSAFKRERKRAPTTEEVDQLVETWILNEICYRAALAEGLDKGDEMVRERLIQKVRLLVFSNLTIPAATDADLREFLEKNRARYDIPDLLSFFEVSVGGPDSKEQAADILRQIEAGEEPEDIQRRAHVFIKRPRTTIADVFGKSFTDGLTTMERGRWGMLQSSVGWHIVRLDVLAPGRPSELSEVRERLVADLDQDRKRQSAIAKIREMGSSFVIRRNDRS